MKTTTATSTQGIMTVEVGAISGDVEIETREAPAGVAVTVAYAGARDTYTVEGSPAPAGTGHDEIIKMLTADTDSAARLP